MRNLLSSKLTAQAFGAPQWAIEETIEPRSQKGILKCKWHTPNGLTPASGLEPANLQGADTDVVASSQNSHA